MLFQRWQPFCFAIHKLKVRVDQRKCGWKHCPLVLTRWTGALALAILRLFQPWGCYFKNIIFGPSQITSRHLCHWHTPTPIPHLICPSTPSAKSCNKETVECSNNWWQMSVLPVTSLFLQSPAGEALAASHAKPDMSSNPETWISFILIYRVHNIWPAHGQSSLKQCIISQYALLINQSMVTCDRAFNREFSTLPVCYCISPTSAILDHPCPLCRPWPHTRNAKPSNAECYFYQSLSVSLTITLT